MAIGKETQKARDDLFSLEHGVPIHLKKAPSLLPKLIAPRSLMKDRNEAHAPACVWGDTLCAIPPLAPEEKSVHQAELGHTNELEPASPHLTG